MASSSRYTYKSMSAASSELERSGQHRIFFDTYLVVVEWISTAPTKGTDMAFRCRVADEGTADICRKGVQLMLFAASENDLPVVEQGDVIRLHRVAFNVWNGEAQLFGKVGTGVSFAVFGGEEDDAMRPKSHSGAKFSFDPAGRERLVQVRERRESILASVDVFMPRAPRASAGPTTKICELEPKRVTPFDLTCEVVWLDKDDPAALVAYVWDGTDSQPFSTDVNYRVGEDAPVDPEHSRSREQFSLNMLKSCHLEHASAQIRVGTFMPVILESEVPLHVAESWVGRWVTFKGIGRVVCYGMMHGFYLTDSTWKWLEKTGTAENLVAKASSRLAANDLCAWAPQADSRGNPVKRGAEGGYKFITRTMHPSKPYTSIRQMKSDTRFGKPNKYHVLARIIGHKPSLPENFCRVTKRVVGGENGEPRREEKVFTFGLSILLEDATGAVEVYLCDREAELMLGMKAADFKTDFEKAEEVKERVESLMGWVDTSYRLEWVPCCILTFFKDKQDPWDSCRYRIFHTLWNG